MKKIIMLCLLTLTMSVAYSQKVVTDSIATNPTTVGEVERLIDKYGGKIVAFAESLKVPAEHVYTVLIRQYKISAISNLIVWATSILACIIFIKLLHYWARKEDESVFDSEGRVALYITLWVVIGVLVIAFLVCLGDNITALLNPEYGALKEIMEVVF